jgi:hypothetical protein
MPNAPKFFQVATEGATIDGREIKRAWLEEAAAHYDPRLYAARINLEHLTSYFPDSTFRQYGDVLALRAEEIKAGPLTGRMALFAQIAPLPELKAITQQNQKLFTSIEVYENFAGTGHAYVTAIAVTDTPASLGTERLQFSAQHGGLFSAPAEIDNPFLASAAPADSKDDAYMKKEDFIAGLKAIFAPVDKTEGTNTPENNPAPSGATDSVAPELEALSSALGALKEGQDKAAADNKAALDKLAADFATLKGAHDALVEKLAQEPAGAARKPATGAASDLPDVM